MVLDELRPGETVTICLPLFIAGGPEERDFAGKYPTITVDGCEKRCARKSTEKLSGKPSKSLLIPEILEKHGIATGFINKTMDVKGVKRAYCVYVPREYTFGKPWPLILFLHGIGERGDDGLAQTEVGIGRAIRRHADRFPCLVVMPQCPDGVMWSGALEDIATALADARKEYAVDPERIYLTGLSMGGFAAWQYGALHADVFAALIPICGGGNPKDAGALARLPIRAFHGADDTTVPPKKSREMVEAVKQANGDIQYTEFPGVGHNAWDSAYDNAETIQWLLKQRKK
jgi:predicted peptidase